MHNSTEVGDLSVYALHVLTAKDRKVASLQGRFVSASFVLPPLTTNWLVFR